jgi:hypothetical protein
VLSFEVLARPQGYLRPRGAAALVLDPNLFPRRAASPVPNLFPRRAASPVPNLFLRRAASPSSRAAQRRPRPQPVPATRSVALVPRGAAALVLNLNLFP